MYRTVYSFLRILPLVLVAAALVIPTRADTTISGPKDIPTPSETQQLHQIGPGDNDNNNHRIAILIPFLSKSQPILPSYFPIFLQSVGGLSPLIDFFILHNGQLSPLIHEYDTGVGSRRSNDSSSRKRTIVDVTIPENVKFIDLHNMTYFTSQFLQVMNMKREKQERVNHSPTSQRSDENDYASYLMDGKDYDRIYKHYTHFLQANPYILIEFKPALGYIFQDYISNYTHWGYSDLDIFFGDLLSWITKDELTNFDVVTYGFGDDQHKAYLRGQFTFHRNDMDLINKLWSSCDYLYHFDSRFMVFLREQKFQLQSAEGCYSSVVNAAGLEGKLTIKYAAKAWTNPVDDKEMNQFGVSAIFMNHDNTSRSLPKRNILLKKSNAATGAEYLHLMSTINSTSAIASANDLPALMQWEVGEMIPIHMQGEGARCMSWAPQQYQSNICIRPEDNVTNRHTVFLIDGKLYKQSFEERANVFFLSPSSRYHVEENKSALKHPIIESRALFHIQEWKRNYRSAQLSSLQMEEDSLTGWTFYPEGVIPLFENRKLTKLNQNHFVTSGNDNGNKEHQYLPSQYFCFLFKEKNHHQQYRDDCEWAVSWYDDEVYKIYGDEWGSSYPNSTDITLALTLRIKVFHHTNSDMNTLLDVLKANISNWNDKPFVLLISIVGSKSKRAFQKVSKKMNVFISSLKYTNYLIGIIQKETNENDEEERKADLINKHAMMNMAESSSLTRWTIVGMDVEQRKMILSKEALYFAQRAAISHEDRQGHIFVIPDFIMEQEYGGSSILRYPSASSLSQLFQTETTVRSSQISSPEFDNSNPIHHIRNQLHALWWDTTKLETAPFEKNSIDSSSLRPLLDSQINDVTKRITKIQVQLNQLLLVSHTNEIENAPKSALMVDRYTPMGDHTLTSHLVPEFDESCDCMNILRLSLFSILNYRIKPLVGAFTRSRTMTSISFDQRPTKCDTKILEEETLRMAKMIILQRSHS